MARPEKVEAVQQITEHFNDSAAALLTEYRGLTVTEMAELRRDLRGVDADYKVLKNTLARIAVREVGLDELAAMLEGPTAIAFAKGDAVEAAKTLDEATRKFPVLVVKGGVLRGRVIDAEQAKALARLEPREVQLTKIAMMFNQPLQQTVNVFSALLRDLGSMLAQVLAQKEEAGEQTQRTPAVDAPEGGPDEPTTTEPAPAVDAPEGQPEEQQAEAAIAATGATDGQPTDAASESQGRKE